MEYIYIFQLSLLYSLQERVTELLFIHCNRTLHHRQAAMILSLKACCIRRLQHPKSSPLYTFHVPHRGSEHRFITSK